MKAALRLRLRAGILPLVIAISLIMASLCSAVLLLAYYHSFYSKRMAIKSKLQRNLISAIQLGLAAPEQLPLNEWIWFDLYEQGIDSVGVHRSYWGVYELLQVKALQGPHHQSKGVLVGTSPAADAPALYVADQKRALKIVGDALIKGDAYLPEAGITVGYIGSTGYGKSQLVFGKSLKSEATLPPYEKTYEEGLQKLLSIGAGLPVDSLREMQVFSFGQPEAAIFYSALPIVLNHNHKLQGKLLIKSDKHISVSREAQLDGVLLVAPKIQLERGFKGSLQAFASDTLLLGEDVQLSYPSAVGVLQDKENALLALQAGASVEGMIILLSATKSEGRGLVWLHEKSKVMGQVYVEGKTQHQGLLHGSLYTQQMFVRTPSSPYDHHLYNGQLDRGGLAAEFVGSTMLPVKGKRKIIAWLL